VAKNPKQHEALQARRERQRIDGAAAMKEYLNAQEAMRRKTERLRAERLAKEAREQNS
jgi:hypothetical protein